MVLTRRLGMAAAAAAVIVSVAGCSSTASQSPAASTAASAAASSAASATPEATVAGWPKDVPTVKEDTHLKIAFFGFSKTNGFAQATFNGISNYAAKHNADVTFIDSNFDGQKQLQAVQDATTSGQYKVFIIQANDGNTIIPAVKAAMAAGITVVGQFTPIGARFDTAETQVPGMIYVGDVPTENGQALAKMGLDACKTITGTCTVAYLQGFANYPLDVTRTKAASDALKAGGATVIDSYVGGYTRADGQKAGQDLLQAHPEVNVIIGSSQAIEGLATLDAAKGKLLIGNGASTGGVKGVQDGTWFSIFYLSETNLDGPLAAAYGLAAARGATVPASTDMEKIATWYGTKTTLAGLTGEYVD
jgi:ribose transport system substrate-binding protein